MKSRVFTVLVLFVALPALTACGGAPTTPSAGNQGSQPNVQGGDYSYADLPQLNELPEPAREASLQGPGWLELHPKSTVQRVGGQPSLPGEIVLEAAGGAAYAIYGVRNFDANCFPTSVRLDLENISGQYYVGFSDYIAGSWRFTHPWTGPATIEIPNIDDYSSPLAYTSEHGWHYFVIIIPEGGGLTITGVEIGVHGGTLGPARPSSIYGSGGESGFVLSWMHSADYLRPDFAGYILERAPWSAGDFSRLTPAPILNSKFCDTSAVPGLQYRYRIAAIDTSGNQSDWRYSTGGPDAGAEAPPVALVDAPRGHFYGPAEITFDLSSSFDPEGEGIDNYGIEIPFTAIAEIGPSPYINVTLQPGCFTANAVVEAGGRVGVNSFPLVVYPRWRDDSIVVSDPEILTWGCRLEWLRGGRLPGTDRAVLIGADRSIPALALWYERESGQGFDLHIMPAYYNPEGGLPGVMYISEPITAANEIYFPVCASGAFQLARFDGVEAELLYCIQSAGGSHVVAATDGASGIWLFYHQYDGLTPRIYTYSAFDSGPPVVVVDDLIDGLESIDAVYNPNSGMVDIVYSYNDGGDDYVRWLEWDPIMQAPGASAPVGGGTFADYVDVEFNPASGRSAAVFHRLEGGNHRNIYSSHEGGLVWSAMQEIDSSGDNSFPVDLASSGGRLYAYFGMMDDTARLYELDSGVWSTRNLVSLPNPAVESVLLPNPNNDDFLLADRNFDSYVFVANLHDDGTDTLWPWALISTEGQGFELHGAAGGDGLHAIWRSQHTGGAHHYVSFDGSEWTDAGDLFGQPRGLDLTATADGTVYCSFVDIITDIARLQSWDGAAFIDEETLLDCDPYNRPFLTKDPYMTDVVWVVDQDVPPHTMHYFEGNAGGGFFDAPTVLDDFPVWNGAFYNRDGIAGLNYLAIAGGANADDAAVGIIDMYGGELNPLYETFTDYPRDPLVAYETWGRNLACAQYLDENLGLVSYCFWATHGTLLNAVRYEKRFPLFGESELISLPMQISSTSAEWRRTVSGVTAWGPTAVALIADLGCTDVYFEWSNFGDWEKLSLPDNLDYMTMPELIVGRDGRWHIVYKNYLTDQIMCRSTR